MADSSQHSGKDVKSPNIFDRAKEEIEAALHGETHGLRDDIDENTAMDDVKAPNMFERVKEEIEAVVQAFQDEEKSHIRSPDDDGNGPNLATKVKEEIGSVIHRVMGDDNGKESKAAKIKQDIESMIHQAFADDKENGPNLAAKIKEGMESIIYRENTPHHHKETHGRSDDINENTPIDEVKAPNVFERVKEEFEALAQTVQHKEKESAPAKEGGFGASIWRGLEKVCSAASIGRGLEIICSTRKGKKD